MVRRTRNHSDLRFGSSVRGAIDTAVVAASLSAMRNASVETTAIGLDSALVALTGRVRLREGSVRTAEEVITEIFADVFGVKPEDGDAGKAGAPTGATNSR
jgi:MoxR-like ATPase